MRLSNRKSLFVLFALATILATGLPARSQGDAGREVVQELVTLFSAWSDQRAGRPIFAAAARHIDYGTMAELSFTPAQWDGFTSAQKRDLIESFQKLVEDRYYMRWHKLFLRSRLTIASEAKAGGDTYVRTFLTHGKDEDTVIWRLRPRNGDPMVISLDVNGKDLINRLSERFQKQLKKHGANGLVVWLKKEAEELEEAEDTPANLRRSASSN
jgi:ABC-type transporter MlaC component